MSVASGPASQRNAVCTVPCNYESEYILVFTLAYFVCFTAPSSGVPTYRLSLTAEYSLSLLSNRRGKAGIFLIYGIRRLGNTGLIEEMESERTQWLRQAET
jgi:hypothetical protein